MKKSLITPIIFLSLFLFNSAHAKLNDDVQQAIETFLYGASVNDSAAHRNFWSEQLTYTSSSGERFGWAELSSGLSDAKPLSEEDVSAWYTGEDFEFKRFGDAVLVNFTLVSTPVDNEQSQQRFYNTGVLIKEKGAWRAVNWNATKATIK